MKSCRSLMLAASLSAALPLICVAPAHAQSNPSADQIMRSLQPSGGMLGTTRGIRPVGPAAPAPASPAASAPASPHRPVTQAAAPGTVAPSAPATATTPATAMPSVSLTVQFPNGSAELTPQAMKTLTELGKALSSNTLSTYRFRIEGHTDTVGSADSNKALSERRAETVVTFLMSRFGIDRSRLDPVGMGEDGLLVQTPANTAEPRNRRVQVINLGA